MLDAGAGAGRPRRDAVRGRAVRLVDARILAASDGSAGSSGALRLARLFEPRLGSGVEVVTVWEPIPIAGIGTGAIVAPTHLEWEASGSAAQREQVLHHLTQRGISEPQWPVNLVVGPPAPTIARRAHEEGAPLIVLGLGRHELMDLLEPGSEVHLVHVLWHRSAEAPWVGGTDWTEERRRRANAELESVAELLTAGTELTVYTHLRSGEAAREVLRLADNVGAELIAAGSHGTGFLGRILMGSVSSRIVRGATCAVLVSPPRSVPAEVLEHARLTAVG